MYTSRYKIRRENNLILRIFSTIFCVGVSVNQISLFTSGACVGGGGNFEREQEIRKLGVKI